MMWMLSPAEFVWMIRSFESCAATKEKDTAHRATPARITRPPRNTWLFVIFVLPLFSDTLRLLGHLSGEKFVYRESKCVICRYFTVSPNTNAFNVIHSG